MFSIKFSLFLIALTLFSIHWVEAGNKYSKEANKPKTKIKTEFSMPTNIDDLRQLDKPFRMHKINLIWTKAKHRLTDPKLQSLFSDLKIHDKEEITFKHQKADGKDETGLEEARLRKKLIGIMSTYDLLEHFEEVDPKTYKKEKPFKSANNYIAKDVFKDKRLNQLWAKAERGGFTDEELEALKEEFGHHQDKIDEYMSLMTEMEAEDPDKQENSLHEKHDSLNEIDSKEEDESNNVPGKSRDDYVSKVQLLKKKHLDVRSGFDHLEGVTGQGPRHKEFVDPKVQGLWRLANEAKFSREELASLKEELMHYEKRLLKLRHLHTEAAVEAVRRGKDYTPNATHETYIKKHARDVEKLHRDIEDKIASKHSEL